MDSYKKENPESGKPKPAADVTPPRGSGNLHADTFRNSGTSSLNRQSGLTKRLGTAAGEVERTIAGLQIEVDNGRIIVSKLEGRMAVLDRAVRIVSNPIEAAQICAGIGAGEANFTKDVAKLLGQDPAVTRRVQVAMYQFEQACKGLDQAAETLERANLYEGAVRTQFVETHCHVEKLRGQLYPLINLHVVFKDQPLLAQLIPPPRIITEPEFPPLPVQPSAEELAAQQAAKSPTSGLAREILAADPAVAQVVESFQRVTGSLKDKFLGVFGKKET